MIDSPHQEIKGRERRGDGKGARMNVFTQRVRDVWMRRDWRKTKRLLISGDPCTHKGHAGAISELQLPYPETHTHTYTHGLNDLTGG